MAESKNSAHALAKLNDHIPDLERLSQEDRDAFMKVFYAGIGAAAAMQAGEADMTGVNLPEFYGKSPTDLRREFSPLPRPAQGGDGGRYQQHRKTNGA